MKIHTADFITIYPSPRSQTAATSGDVQDILSVKERMAQEYLRELELTKLLRKTGNGPAAHYVLNA